jgi:hypothetical protein
MILILFAVAMFFRQIANERDAAFDKLKKIIGPAEQAKSQMEDESRKLKIAQTQCDHTSVWLGDKCYWGSVLVALREAMIAVETKKEAEHGTRNIGVWVERLAPIIPTGYLSVSIPPPQGICGNTNFPGGEPPPPPQGGGPGGPPGLEGRGRGFRGRGPGGDGGNRPMRQAPSSGGPEIDCILLTCRGVNLKSIGDAANTGLANAVEEELKSRTTYFDADSTKLVGEAIGFDTTNLTISFTVQVKLARPMKL